ncbi:DUF4190 domain-containing protein [Nucisporomicrobium flavum]|uniref:DUF4190 domain-containing protein n=1 Tax=Nucisporomicrobium flavum TaxID=2785915 RepID=UPI003C2B2036
MTQQPHPQPYASQPGPYANQPGPYANQPGPYANQPFPPAPGFAPPPQQAYPGTNGFAIASLIFGILGGVLFATVFGIVGLVQTRRRPQRGKGLAITGLVLAGCWITAIVVGVAIAVATDDTSTNDASGRAGFADAFNRVPVDELEVGQCLGSLDPIGGRSSVPLVACGKPHKGEVYATFDLPRGPYPGEKAVEKQANDRCTEELDRYAPDEADTLDVYYQYPDENSWFLDRGVRCIASDPKGPMTGSLHD